VEKCGNFKSVGVRDERLAQAAFLPYTKINKTSLRRWQVYDESIQYRGAKFYCRQNDVNVIPCVTTMTMMMMTTMTTMIMIKGVNRKRTYVAVPHCAEREWVHSVV